MKVVLNKAPEKKNTQKQMQQATSKPRQRGFLRRFLDACKDDLKEKIAKLKGQRKWNGYVPPIEPRYR